MNILMVGTGKGSFEVRGKQLGKALGARVVKTPHSADLEWADVVVLIKHASKYAKLVHIWKRPLVWDALDFWRQPDQNALTQQQAFTLFHSQIRTIRPTLTIGATEAMAEACDGVYLPHHSWPNMAALPPREQVIMVGYEGTKKYLGAWLTSLQAECSRRSWLLSVGQQIGQQDIRIALRDEPWDGWICREWKSGVKMVNAMAQGCPVITQGSAAFREIRPAGGILEDFGSLSAALDAFESKMVRASAQAYCLKEAQAFTLKAVAERYRQILSSVAKKAA